MSYAVQGDAQPKIFNIMFALGMASSSNMLLTSPLPPTCIIHYICCHSNFCHLIGAVYVCFRNEDIFTLLTREGSRDAGIIAFAFGDTILPEVQATCGGNAKMTMYKGVSFGYSILLTSYMVVAIAGALHTLLSALAMLCYGHCIRTCSSCKPCAMRQGSAQAIKVFCLMTDILLSTEQSP